MVAKVVTAPKGPEFSELVQGYWRAVEWGMTAQERLSFLKQHIEGENSNNILIMVLCNFHVFCSKIV